MRTVRERHHPDAPPPPTISFLGLTSWPRPAPSTLEEAQALGWHPVPFVNRAELDAAVAAMQPYDYIYYAGQGVLTISGSNNGYRLQNKHPASPGVVINFGTSKSIWAPQYVSANYVRFVHTGTAYNWHCFVLDNCSNLRLYGGDLTNDANLTSSGILVSAAIDDVLWWDWYIHHVGGGGLGASSSLVSGGYPSHLRHLDVRGEVNRFILDPSHDTHPDKGTGSHGMILHGNGGEQSDSIFTCYAHDALQPGENPNWPRGGGGSVIEPGDNAGGPYERNTYYALGERLKMIPDTQTGGNIMNFWGMVPENGDVVGWAEGHDCTGAVVYGASGQWDTANPPVTVLHGRHSNMNQSTAGSNIAEPYDSRHPIVYQDCF